MRLKNQGRVVLLPYPNRLTCMRCIISVLICTMVLCTHMGSYAQLTINMHQVRPTGKLGFTLENKLGVGLGYVSRFEDRLWRTSISGSFFRFKTRMEAYPAAVVSGSFAAFFGKAWYTKYNIGWLDFFEERILIQKERWRGYAGIGIVIGNYGMQYNRLVPYRDNSSYRYFDFKLGIAGRLGLEYDLNDTFSFRFSADRKYCIFRALDFYSANQIQLGVSIYFN